MIVKLYDKFSFLKRREKKSRHLLTVGSRKLHSNTDNHCHCTVEPPSTTSNLIINKQETDSTYDFSSDKSITASAKQEIMHHSCFSPKEVLRGVDIGP